MIEQLDQLDQELFLLLNGLHHEMMDPFMIFISNKLSWVPLYFSIVVFLIIKYKRKDALYILLSIALIVIATDQLTSSFMKPFFERLRPCHNSDIQPIIYVVDRCGGMYGFASSHAANFFGWTTFLWLLFKRKYARSYLFLWIAALVSYSRVYLGVHYPGDIIIGGLIGTIIASIIYFIYAKTNQKYK